MDKTPGVRPIGIGDVLQRILAKAILYCIGDDIAVAVGSLQACAGQVTGCKAAIDIMRDLFDASSEAALLADASSTFYSVNRQAALHNIWFSNSSFVTGQGEISSHEGTTQGDPHAMSMYAPAVVPLIR